MKTRLILVSSTVLLLTACMNKTQEKASVEATQKVVDESVKLPDRGLPYQPFTFAGEALMHFRKMASFINAAYRLIKNNGSEGKDFDGQAVFDLERRFVGTEAMKNTLDMVMKDPAAREII